MHGVCQSEIPNKFELWCWKKIKDIFYFVLK